MIIILTGQPHSGKTTLANYLKAMLNASSLREVFIVDGDDLREIVQNKDYSEAGRRKNIETAHSIAKYLKKQNKQAIVIISLVSPFIDLREKLKEETGALEFYIHTSEIRGRESFHVIDYQKPLSNYTEIDTTEDSEINSLNLIADKIEPLLKIDKNYGYK